MLSFITLSIAGTFISFMLKNHCVDILGSTTASVLSEKPTLFL